MNLILFKKEEELGFLPKDDARYKHIMDIIKVTIGDKLDFGIIGGKKGKITITRIEDRGFYFDYNLDNDSPALYPVTLIIGTPRPPVAKRLLKDLSTTGVEKIIMCATDLGEKTYLSSKLWKDQQYVEYIIEGGIQGESTLLPEIERYYSLKKAIESIPSDVDRLAMDNISPDLTLSSYIPKSKNVVICIGGERGFSDRERNILRDSGFSIFKIGERVLRTETACHHVLGSILTTMGLI
ncbi:RsmE family RNA methyltransferase [Thiospirochaeta perfilievii]|uniref:Ribosomal RNA small subunit methyltransferase E n=1 Tax=Thiospirochaeta perfilievii TaxID=252967 RepID=A0A5C1QIC9_9SPIO|nr:RsmE family RNA methyltransferase [Thiospirochaeta perfilievii]QEN06294.1 RsmE family RNA methyltransferase [Thiospirochaeta perfilievii]